MPKRVAILTLVGNTKNGSGPGHSAIVVDDYVYTFENASDWFSSPKKEKSGWLVIRTTEYVTKNNWRPIIVQELNPAHVDAGKVLSYVKKSISADHDYLASGVCSSQVSNAVDAATTSSFNPSGIDTPYKVFSLARNRGLTSETYLIWGQAQDNTAAEKLQTDYATVNQSGAGILNWAS